LDSFQILFHEGELFLNVCEPFQKLVESFGQVVEAPREAFFRLLQSLINGSNDSNVLREQAFLKVLVQSGKS
jgi:hypothetical protein